MCNLFKDSNYPYIIAGPCSVESRQQLATVVEVLLREKTVRMIRCGIWKPRTRPGGFEGLGEPALQWVAELKREHAEVRFCCEVASAKHVELALHYGIDALWIGARTTGSPFAVQEITEALRGYDTPIMVKNAPNPDVHIWQGAIERCLQVGLRHIAAVHRGFDIYNNFGYRNSPLWEVPIELHRLMPDLPIFCDPSHIGGKRELVTELSQTALDLHFDGLMIESHPTPNEALTDSSQQLTLDALTQLLSSLVVKTEEQQGTPAELQALRSQIDAIDHQSLQLMAERFALSQKIGHIKQQNNITIFQPKRWDSLLHDRLQQATHLGLSTAFVKEMMEKIHAESVRLQEEELHHTR